MFKFWPSLQDATVVAVVSGLVSFAVGTAQAATIPFDNTGVPTLVATISGTGGTMNFTLDVDDLAMSNVFGSFSMDVFGPGAVPLGSIGLLGAPFLDGASSDFGSIAVPGVSGGLPNISQWNLAVSGVGELPLTLVVTSSLTGSDPFNPVLTVDFTGDLVLGTASAIPLPGALPLFVTGLAALGLVGRRRKARPMEISAQG